MKVFTKKLAKEIAQKSLNLVIDCILGNSYMDYNLSTTAQTHQTNFEEDLEELGLTVTTSKINLIIEQYDLLVNKLIKRIDKPL